MLDCHNVELRRVETMAATLWPKPRGVVARMQLGAVARFEREAVQSVAGVLAVSEPERDHFERLAPGRVSLVPNGVDPTGYAFRDQVSGTRESSSSAAWTTAPTRMPRPT